MAIKIQMPKLSDTMDTGRIIKWLKKEGEKVSPGDVLAEVETDKANMDMEAYDEGTLLKIVAKEGDRVPIGGLIGVLGSKGEDVSSILSEVAAPAAKPEAKHEAHAATAPPAPQPRFIRVHPDDNVAVVVNQVGLPASARLSCGVALRDGIPAAHHWALALLPAAGLVFLLQPVFDDGPAAAHHLLVRLRQLAADRHLALGVDLRE